MSVEVADGITVGGMVVGSAPAADATMTFSGSTLTFAANSIITSSVGRVVFNNDVKGAGNLTVERAANVVVTSELEEGKGLPFGAENAVTVFKGLKLADVKTVSGWYKTHQGGYAPVDPRGVYHHPGLGVEHGVYAVENDGARLTAEFQGYSWAAFWYRSYYGGTSAWNLTTKIALEQDGDDVKGYVDSAWVLEDVGNYGINAVGKPHSKDVVGYYVGKDSEARGTFKSSIRSVDLALVVPEVVFAANIDLTTDNDTLKAGTGATVRFAGTLGAAENTWSRKLYIADGGYIDIDTPSCANLSNQVFFDPLSMMNTGINGSVQGMLRVLAGREVEFTYNGGSGVQNGWVGIAGTAYLRGNSRGIPLKKFVMDGGRLVSDLTTNGDGIQGSGTGRDAQGATTVGKGGVLTLVSKNSFGKSHNFDLAGGVLNNTYAPASDAERNQFSYLFMGDGAKMAGERTDWVGGEIASYGVEPSRIECAALWVYQGCAFNIEDVTGDETSDLVVASDVVSKASGTFTLSKTDLGTLEFAGAETLVGNGNLEFVEGNTTAKAVYIFDGGTIRFSGKTAEFNALVVSATAALDVVAGTRVAFGDSSEEAWSNKLTLKSKLEKKSLRFGENADGLTSAQLAAIRYADGVTTKTPVFTLDANGYLSDGLMGGGFCIRLR